MIIARKPEQILPREEVYIEENSPYEMTAFGCVF